jgi:hypothetical protein
MCISNVVLMAGGVTSTGGLAAFALKRLGVKSAVDKNADPTESRRSRKEDAVGKIVPNSNQRRDHDVYEHGGESEDRVAR